MGYRLLTEGYCDGWSKLWNASTGSLISSSASRPSRWCPEQEVGQRSPHGAVATSPDGTIVAEASPNGTMQLLDGTSGTPLTTFAAGHEGVQTIAFDRSGATHRDRQLGWHRHRSRRNVGPAPADVRRAQRDRRKRRLQPRRHDARHGRR